MLLLHNIKIKNPPLRCNLHIGKHGLLKLVTTYMVRRFTMDLYNYMDFYIYMDLYNLLFINSSSLV